MYSNAYMREHAAKLVEVREQLSVVSSLLHLVGSRDRIQVDRTIPQTQKCVFLKIGNIITPGLGKWVHPEDQEFRVSLRGFQDSLDYMTLSQKLNL